MWSHKIHTISLIFAVLTACLVIASMAQAADANLPEENSRSSYKTETTPPGNDVNLVGKDSSQFNVNSLFYKLIFSTVLIIALGAVLWYLTKKLLPGFTQSPGRRIQIVETLNLGSKRSVHLLEIEGRRVLIGSTSDRITKLGEFSKTFEQALTREKGRQNTDNDK